MRILGMILVGLVVLAVAAYGAGFMIAREHEARVSGVVAQPPAAVFSRIDQVLDYPRWRTGTTAVRRVEVGAGVDRFEEESSFGPLQYDVIQREPPSRRVTRIVDGGGFGGTWTFELVPVAQGTQVTITEKGYIDSPLFRLLGKFVFGYDRNLHQYVTDLQAVASGSPDS